METTPVSHTSTATDIIIPEMRFTEEMITAFGEGTHEPLRQMHYKEGIVFGIQAETFIAQWLSQVAEVGQYASQTTRFLKPIRKEEILRIVAQREQAGESDQRFRVNVYGHGEKRSRLETTITYAREINDAAATEGGEAYVLNEADARRVHEGQGKLGEVSVYPLVLGLASKPLVELAQTVGDLTEKMHAEIPVYVGHEITAYAKRSDLNYGDKVRLSPKIISVGRRDVKAEVECTSSDGRKIYKIEMDLKFIPAALLRRR